MTVVTSRHLLRVTQWVSFPTWPKFQCVEGAIVVGIGMAALLSPGWEGDAPARSLARPPGLLPEVGWNEWAAGPRAAATHLGRRGTRG